MIVRCAGEGYTERAPFAKFKSTVGGLAWSPDGNLLACVSGRGLFALTARGEVRGQLETVEGAPLDCPTAVAVANDGTIYVTDGSRHNLPERWLLDLMQNRPGSGRLVSCDPHLGNARVRADGLSWPLGVVVSHEQDEVWVSEAWAHRLIAISRAGGKRVLVKNFAGYPARLARGHAGNYWLAFFALRTQLTEFVLRERRFCDEMMERVPPELWIGPSLDGKFNYREPTQIGRIKKLGIEKPWAPARSYGLVTRIGGGGEAVESLHSRVGGQTHGIMTVRRNRPSRDRSFQGTQHSCRTAGGPAVNWRMSMHAPDGDGATPLLQVINGSKVYGGLHAIQDVNFDLRAGEIHALLGENGAGKSTLCKAIAGAINLTSGEYLINGKRVEFNSPNEALKSGVAMVYQETSLVPSMTVARNLELGREKLVTIYSKINIAAQQSQQSLNFNVDPLALVETLGTAKRQMVEIVRAVRHHAKIFIFDEPTASLTPEEIQHFFHLLYTLRDRGAGIIFISHVLEEALKMANRITVLRDGKLVQTSPAVSMDRSQLVRLMIGRDISTTHYASHKRAGTGAGRRGEKVLSVENVTMGSVVKNMSFSVYAGEVVGIAGLVGSGRTEIAHVICGARKRNFLRGGMIYLRGKPVRYRVPRQAINDGIVYITEDRKENGFFETMTVDENIYIGHLASRVGRRILYSLSEMKRVADQWIKALSISSLKRSLKIIEYSGGNQQKVVVGKALAQDPAVVIFDEPTRGVDVSAIPQIHTAIKSLADDGKAVIVISSYLPEVLAISDRILVARGGRIVEEMPASEATEDRVMFAAIH